MQQSNSNPTQRPYTTTVSMLDKKRIAPKGWKFLKIEYRSKKIYTSVRLVQIETLSQGEDAVREITDQMFTDLQTQFNFKP